MKKVMIISAAILLVAGISAFLIVRFIRSEEERYKRPDIATRNEFIFREIDNDTPLEELLTRIAPDYLLTSGISTRFPVSRVEDIQGTDPPEYRWADLYELCADFHLEGYELEAWRLKENGDIYAVIDTDENRRAFLFFSASVNHQFTHMVFVPHPTGENDLQESDFDEITIGETIENYFNLFDTPNANIGQWNKEYYSYFLLKDTLMLVSLELDEEAETYLITDVQSFPDKKITLPAGTIADYGILIEEDMVFDFNVFPQDFPR